KHAHRRAEQDADETDVGPPRIERQPRDELAGEMKGRAGCRDRREMQSHLPGRSAAPAVCGGGDVSALAAARPGSTVATTDMPGRTRTPSAGLWSRTILTGTRCTTLVKLPVALSGGSRAKVLPVPGDQLSTCPVSARSGNASTVTVAGLPART